MKIQLGFIGGVVAPQLKEDFWGVMQQIAGMGYTALEGAGPLLNGDVAANLRRLGDLGMKVITHGCTRDQLLAEPQRLIDEAARLGAAHLTNWWGPCQSKEQILADAEQYNRIGQTAHAAGVRLQYHHHDHELKTVYDNVRALDLLAAHTESASMHFNLDTAWMVYGGVDPCVYLKRFAGRVQVLHMKDIADIYTRARFCALGCGCVPIRQCIEAGVLAGVRYFVYEQDRPHVLSGLDAARASFNNLREMGLV